MSHYYSRELGSRSTYHRAMLIYISLYVDNAVNKFSYFKLLRVFEFGLQDGIMNVETDP